MLRTPQIVTKLVVALICLSCAEQPIAPARNAIALKAPTFDIVAFDATLPTTTASPAATLALPTYSNPIIVRVEIHRTIQIHSDPNGEYSVFSGALDGHGIYVGGVYDGCYANVVFRWTDAAQNVYQSGPGTCVSQPVADTTWRDTLLVKGTGQVSRGPGVPFFPGHCGSSPCHTYGGDQEVVVSQLDVPLGLKVSSPYLGPPGSITTFTAVGVPDTIGARGYKVPVTVVSWAWTAAGGGSGQTVPCNSGVNPCQTRVMESGTMTVTAIVNGVQQTKSATMTVVPCPTGDSLIDKPLNRTALADLWNLSGSTLPIDQRREHRAAVSDTSYWVSPPQPNDGPCQSYFGPGMPSGFRPRVDEHVHPFSVGDSLPSACNPPNLGPNKFTKYSNPYGGPSPADWKSAWDEDLPMLTADKDSIYRIYPFPIDSTPNNGGFSYFPKSGWKSAYLAVPRLNGSCTIL